MNQGEPLYLIPSPRPSPCEGEGASSAEWPIKPVFSHNPKLPALAGEEFTVLVYRNLLRLRFFRLGDDDFQYPVGYRGADVIRIDRFG